MDCKLNTDRRSSTGAAGGACSKPDPGPPNKNGIHPYLLTHHWLDFGELPRQPVDLGTLGSGLRVQVGWVAVAGSLACARFTTADVTA